MGNEGQKKIAIIVVSSLLLVALLSLLVFVFHQTESKKPIKTSASQKAIAAICQTTDYQKTCHDSLKGHNTTDPKELISAAMEATIGHIKAALHNSTAIKHALTDPRAKAALDTCAELGNRAVDDLHRSYSKFRQFDITNVDDILLELKTWISGAMTHQETCIDGFEKVDGDAGERMKKLLTTSMQMTSNALAMVAEISTFLESMGVNGVQQQSSNSSSRRRRLLSYDIVVAEHGSWVDAEKRRLLAVPAKKIRPNIIVAKDGSGRFKTINEALPHIPERSNKTFVLYIKEGIYKEHVHIKNSFTSVMMIGDGPTKTRITGSLNFVDGVGTYQSATVAVHGDDFIARDIGFENSAGAAKMQAVALRASSDKSIYYNCHIEAYQDTLYTHAYRQFYKDCLISGTIDFIFGDSAAVFQDCTLLFRKPLKDQQNIVTAQGRVDLRQPTGLVLQNCTFKADAELEAAKGEFESYIGRPWKEYSRTIVMESFIGDFIHADGWLPWDGDFALQTLFYTEFNNRGPASPKAQRVKWPGLKELPSNRIKRFTAAEFLDGNRWIPKQRVPYAAGFIFPVPKEDPNIKYSPVSTEETKDLGSTAERKKKPNNATAPPPPPTPTPTPPAPAPGPVATAAAPQSSVAAPPTLSQQVPTGAASPTSLSGGSIAPAPFGGSDMEAGDVIIDLSPAPAPAPTPDTSESPLLSPAGSPFMAPQPSAAASPITQAASPSKAPATSPTAASPAATPTPITQAAPRRAPATSPIAASPAATPTPTTQAASPSRAPAASPTAASPAATLTPASSTQLNPTAQPTLSPISAPPPNAAVASPSGGAAPTAAPQTSQALAPTGVV